MNHKRVLVATLALAALAATARAQERPTTWEEPTLEEALGRAKLVVRAKALGAVADEAGTAKVVVDHAVLGKAPADALEIAGTAAGVDLESLVPAAHAGDDAIYILEEVSSPTPGKAALRVSTPSFGRFPVNKGRVQACVRDSFVRVDMAADDYERFLANASAVLHGGAADVAWLASARAALESLDPTATDSLAPAHVALETLCYGAKESDAELALRYFGSPNLQLRISAARLLMRAGGTRAGSGLLRLAGGDAEPAVRSVATLAIAHVKPVPETAVKELAARARDASAAPISLSQGPSDPRKAELASVLAATFEALHELGADDEATSAAIDLLEKDDDATLAVAALHLTRVRPVTRLREIAWKMRDDDKAEANKFIAELLRKITGAPVGPQKDRWLYWLDENKDVFPQGAK